MTIEAATANLKSNQDKEIERDPRWQLIQRIVATPSFARSPRLISFLLFVSELYLKGSAEEINEQSIGVQVFGRAHGYDSNDDNIVRSHASRLRHKLEQYFQEEGIHEILRVHIPRGNYVPEFEYLQPQVLEVDAQSATTMLAAAPTVSHAVSNDRSSARWAIVVFGVALATLAMLWVRDHRSLSRKVASLNTLESGSTQDVHSIWAHILPPSQQTLVVPGDSSLVLYENLTGRTLSVGDYIAGQYRDAVSQNRSRMDPSMLRKITRRRLTTIVDLNVAANLVQLIQSHSGRAVIRYCRDLHINDLKSNNVVLIGAKEANPWIELYEQSLNFILTPNQVSYTFTIQNRLPRPGEQTTYRTDTADPKQTEYALIALLPSLGGTGRTLILQGTTMAGTEAAADFVIKDNELGKILQPYIKDDNEVPNFEILLQTTNFSGDASQSKVLAVRIHPVSSGSL